MGGEQGGVADTIAEQHVRHFLAVGAVQLGAPVDPGDFLQRPGNALRLARELHRRGVGQVFALARDAGLDEAAEEHADIADGEQAQGGDHDRPAALAVAARAVLQHLAADDAQHQDAEQQAHQADVEPHVAVEDVAELVGDDALQLVAAELVQRAAGDGDRRVGRRIAGGEGVDAGLLLQHEDLRHRHAGGNGDLLDHVAQASVRRVVRVGRYQRAAQFQRHLGAAAVERDHAVQGGQGDHRHHRQRGAEEDGQQIQRRVVRIAGPGQRRHRHRIDGADYAEHGQQEQQQQPVRVAAHLGLLLEEVHKAVVSSQWLVVSNNRSRLFTDN